MAATSTGMTRLESFPFDSKADGYDADGYPVYDRAVGASMLRETFAKFFTNGVFPNPGTALQIGKAATGLAVTIQPGIGIINGSMGGVRGDAITVQLDTASPQGNVAYALMLRYDNTDGFADSRSLLVNVVKSDAASTPAPPAPDTTTPEVYELRLGYVVVPSGATDLSEATVTNEKGLDVCPFAAPFEEIDVDGIVSDFRNAANEGLTDLIAYYNANKAAIDAALDGSAATYLQQQITALQEQMDNFDLSGSVDNTTIEYATAAGEASPKLRVKDGGIGTEQIAANAVTDEKITANSTFVPLTGADGQVLTRSGDGVEWGDMQFVPNFEGYEYTGSSFWDTTINNTELFVLPCGQNFLIVFPSRNKSGLVSPSLTVSEQALPSGMINSVKLSALWAGENGGSSAVLLSNDDLDNAQMQKLSVTSAGVASIALNSEVVDIASSYLSAYADNDGMASFLTSRNHNLYFNCETAAGVLSSFTITANENQGALRFGCKIGNTAVFMRKESSEEVYIDFYDVAAGETVTSLQASVFIENYGDDSMSLYTWCAPIGTSSALACIASSSGAAVTRINSGSVSSKAFIANGAFIANATGTLLSYPPIQSVQNSSETIVSTSSGICAVSGKTIEGIYMGIFADTASFSPATGDILAVATPSSATGGISLAKLTKQQ